MEEAFMRLDANTTWFNFTAQSGDFGVYAFSGLEEASHTYEFVIELVSRSANVDVAGLLGTPARLSIADVSGDKRMVHGLIREMEQLHTANRFTHYRAVLVPRLWFLRQATDYRIFQNLSVVEIIQQILQEQGFSGDDFSFKLSYSYTPREYCVQYGETVLHFISRLCEEEGIYFYFEHTEGSHTLCFCDREGGPKISGDSDLRFHAGSGQAADTAVISRLKLHHMVNSNVATYREWNFTQPKLDLNITEQELDPQKAPVPQGMNLEQYHYPHLYELRATGTRYAKLQLSRQLTFSRWIECEADVSRFLPSYTFSLHDHPRSDVNAGWWIVSVHHQGEQPGVLEHEAPGGRGLQYRTYVKAIPEATRFVPALVHTKLRVPGQQTAIITGPSGEEIYSDKYGRVKVQFFWDREGVWDEKTTCWVRVAQGAASGQFGAVAVPRMGDEVIVSFLEGDPDRPVITGRVFHDLNMPPYDLPGNKTRMAFKTFSSPKSGGFNELRIEDKANNEELYMRAEKDVNVFVKNDWSDQVCANSHHLTGKDSFTRTVGETHRILEKNRITLLGATDQTTVGEDAIRMAAKRDIAISGTETQIYSNGVMMLEAKNGISLRCGNSVITLTPDNISIDSTDLWLNCAYQEPVTITEFTELKAKPPKGADSGSKPSGSEMAKPMPPRGMPPIAQSATAAGAPPDMANTTVATDMGLMQNGMVTPVAPAQPTGSGPATATGTTAAVGATTAAAAGKAQAGTSAAQALTPAPGQPVAPAWASNPTVRAAMEKAWNDSNPNAPEVKRGVPGSLKKENGGWVVKNPDGSYRVDMWPSGTRDGMIPPAMPSGTEGAFHTHPNTANEGYALGPSPADKNFFKNKNLPSVIPSHGGMYVTVP